MVKFFKTIFLRFRLICINQKKHVSKKTKKNNYFAEKIYFINQPRVLPRNIYNNVLLNTFTIEPTNTAAKIVPSRIPCT